MILFIKGLWYLRGDVLKKLVYCLGLLIFTSTNSLAKDQRVYQTDKFGNIQYHLPSYTVEDNGRIVETDKFGNKQYHKDGYQIKGDKIQGVDGFGNVQPSKYRFSTKK